MDEASPSASTVDAAVRPCGTSSPLTNAAMVGLEFDLFSFDRSAGLTSDPEETAVASRISPGLDVGNLSMCRRDRW